MSSPIYHEVACFQAPVLAFSFNMAKTIVSNFGTSHPQKKDPRIDGSPKVFHTLAESIFS